METIKYGSAKNPKNEETPPYCIYKLDRLYRLHMSEVLKSAGAPISPEQYILLLTLYNQDGVTQKSLANPVLQDHPNVTRLLDGLEKNLYIERRPVSGDRRKFAVHLTSEGTRLIQSLFPYRIEEIRHLFKGVSRKEVNTLMTILKKLETNLIERLPSIE